jgi:DNA polymerase III subunit delta'
MAHNWPVYGHDGAVDFLVRGMTNGRLRHAYLIVGAPSTGKHTLARIFAMALNCEDADPARRPCGECRTCKLITGGSHPDVMTTETDPATGALKIEAIRGVTSRIAMKPYQARMRVTIMPDFDHAQPRAQDALLKTLEEPPDYAVLVLLAASLESILPTILSRSQIIQLRPAPAVIVRDVLIQRLGMESVEADAISRFSGGRVGWAICAAQDESILQERAEALDLLESIVGMNRGQRFAMAEKLSGDKAALADRLELWLTYWRDVLLQAEGTPVKVCNVDRRAAIERILYTVDSDQARAALHATRALLDRLPTNINLRLALEVMLLDYPGLEITATS